MKKNMMEPSFEKLNTALLSRNFADKKLYDSNKLFLGRELSFLKHSTITSVSQQKLKGLLDVLNDCASTLRSVQDQIRDDKLCRTEGIMTQIKVWLRHRFLSIPQLDSLIQSINLLASENGISSFRVKTFRSERFLKIVHGIKIQSKGATAPGARVLHESYLREPLGLHLIIDKKWYNGKIYMGFFREGKSTYWNDWKTQVDENKVSYRHLYSFEDYMNQKVIPNLEEEKKAELIQACNDVVEYYTPKELIPLEVSFDADGKLCTANSLFNAWTQRLEEGKAHKTSFREFIKSTSISSDNDKNLVIGRSAPFIFVLTSDKKLYIQIKQRGKAHHTSLSTGKAVLAAGELRVTSDSSLSSLNPFSGHYWPGNPELISMLDFLRSKNVDIDQLLFTYTTDNNGHTDKIQRGLVSQWLLKERSRSANTNIFS